MSLIVRARHITTIVDGKPFDVSYGETLPDGIAKKELARLQEIGAVQEPGLPLPHQAGMEGFVAPPVVAIVEAAAAQPPPPPEKFDAASASDAELQAWLVHVKPVAEDTIAAASGDPDLAKRIAVAEQQATDRPRKGVLEALAAITDKPA